MMPERENLGLIESFAQIIRLPFSVWNRRSIQHTQDLHIGNVMKHILINIDKTPVVVNHSLKLRFKQSHQFFIWAYKGIY